MPCLKGSAEVAEFHVCLMQMLASELEALFSHCHLHLPGTDLGSRGRAVNKPYPALWSPRSTEGNIGEKGSAEGLKQQSGCWCGGGSWPWEREGDTFDLVVKGLSEEEVFE